MQNQNKQNKPKRLNVRTINSSTKNQPKDQSQTKPQNKPQTQISHESSNPQIHIQTSLQSQNQNETNSLSIQSLQITKIPLQTSLHEYQLHNHYIRKQIESNHKKTISQFYKKKKQLTKFIHGFDQISMKRKQVLNKMEFHQKNVGKNQEYCLKHMGNRKYYSTTQKHLKRNTQYAILSNQSHHTHSYTNSQNIHPLPYQSTAPKQNPYLPPYNISKNSQNYTSCLSHVNQSNSSINKRQIYLSNITNLDQLRQSFNYSRAKFNRKIIKMDREIGRQYYPFQDRLLGDQNGIKGIFL